jgi:hypothetical protein
MNDGSLIDLNPIRSSGTDNLAYDDDDDEEELIISPASNHTDSKLIDETTEGDSASGVNFRGNCANTKLVYFIDSIISAFIFAPLSALYWYGTWSLFDVYLLPNYQLTSALISYVIGLIILLPGYIFQEKIQDLYNKRNELVQFLIRFIYAYFVSLACVLEWRGLHFFFKKNQIYSRTEFPLIMKNYLLVSRDLCSDSTDDCFDQDSSLINMESGS